MSETVEGIDKAVREHVAAVAPGDLLGGWFLVGYTVLPDRDDAVGYWYQYSEQQPQHVTLGLVEMAREKLRRQIGVEDDD